MKIQNVPIETLIPYAFNNRIHPPEQINRLANSIQQFGWVSAIVVDENNVVLMGHGRLEAARKLGYKEVPVYVRAGLSDAEKKALRVIDNKTAGDSHWDMNNLELELQSLKEQGFEFEKFGLDDFDFGDPPGEDDAETPTEPEPDAKWIGVITLKVPAEQLEHFEPELNELLKRFNGINKSTSQKTI